MQYTFFDSGGMCVAMVTAYYAKTCGKRCFQINFGTHFGREIFLKFVYENGIFCVHIIMPLLWGRLCEAAYTNPLLPLVKIYFTPIEGSMGPYAP